MTKSETVLEALRAQLAAGLPAATVRRNSTVPEEIPSGGLVILRDGEDPDYEEFCGFTEIYYTHSPEIEIYVADADQEARDAAFAALAGALGQAIESDRTLGGAIDAGGLSYGAPGALTEPVEGGADIKAAIVILTLNYSASSPLG